MIKSYVISLPSASQRRAHIIQEFAEKQISFEFFDAFSPSERMNETASELIPALLQNTTLTNGEKGCLLSHLVLWKRCVDNNLDYIAVFEDDIIFSEEAAKYIKSINQIPSSNFILKLESFPMKAHFIKICRVENRHIYALKSTYVGSAGYIISNQAATFLVGYFKYLSKEEILPVDEILFNQLINRKLIDIYQFSPALCIQDRFYNGSNKELGSNLEMGRLSIARNKERSKNSLLTKIKKQFLRTFNFRKKIPFK